MNHDQNILTTEEAIKFFASLEEGVLLQAMLNLGISVEGLSPDRDTLLHAFATDLRRGLVQVDRRRHVLNNKLESEIHAEIRDAEERATSAKTTGTTKKYEQIRKELTASLRFVPALWLATEASYQGRLIERHRRYLESLVTTATSARHAFANKVLSSPAEAIYAMEWQAAAVDSIHKGVTAEKILTWGEVIQESENVDADEGLRRAIARFRKQESQNLLDNRYDARSSGAYHNAVESSKRGAISGILQGLGLL